MQFDGKTIGVMVMNAAVQVRSMVWVGRRVEGELDSRTKGTIKWGV